MDLPLTTPERERQEGALRRLEKLAAVGQEVSTIAHEINSPLEALTNLLYHAHLSDMETCYKLCRTEVLTRLELESNGFDIEPEITAKLLRRGYTIREIAVSYQPRTRAEGKTIDWRDGIRALMTLLRWRFTRKA